MLQPIRCAIAFAALVVCLNGSAQTTRGGAETGWKAEAYEIPMRDGVRLHTIVIAPKRASHTLPILLRRTPYGVPDELVDGISSDQAKSLDKRSYIRVEQDIRGRHKSQGEFTMMRPPHAPGDVHGIDECTDNYDTIDWLIKHVERNNGRVGIYGVSYDGWLAAMALIHPHPALKAASPQAPVADMFLGDDFHHNGAFRLSYGFEYVWMMESGKDQDVNWPIVGDAYNWYLKLGALSSMNANYLHGTRPTWNSFVAHPNYDAFWQTQAIAPYLDQPLAVPTMLVGGWYDQEDFYGPQRIYAELVKHDPSRYAYLVLGPWNHGGWSGPGYDLGPLQFGSATGTYFKQEILGPWFDHWLKDKPLSRFPHVWTFETGGNRWKKGETWPPQTAASRDLYLAASRAASFKAPTDAEHDAYDSYVSDPSHPAPYRKRPILPTYGAGSNWYTWLTDDQRDLGRRADVVTWKTAPLEHDVVISGDVVADLFASTTGTDSDWVVKLLDVYPQSYRANPRLAGYESIVSDEVFRGRFRNSFERPEAIPSGSVQEYKFDLHSADHVFLAGHRIGVQIQSAWFPLIDRNPQRFVPSIFKAHDNDFQVATQRIYRSKRYPTHIVLPVALPTLAPP